MHNPTKKISLFFILFLFVFSSINGQYYSSGQDPANIKWKQINTPNFQIIFPENYETQAQYLANIIDSAYHLVAYSLDGQIKRTSIIIHNQTVTSNGTTAWAPTRVDLYSTSPQQIYAQKWMDQLILHEIRHLIQIEKLNTGFTKILKYILGEQALAFARDRSSTAGSDFDRVNRQKYLLSEIIRQKLNFSVITKAPQIIRVLNEETRSDFTIWDFGSIGFVLLFSSKDMNQVTIPTEPANIDNIYYLLADKEEVVSFLSDYLK